MVRPLHFCLPDPRIRPLYSWPRPLHISQADSSSRPLYFLQPAQFVTFILLGPWLIATTFMLFGLPYVSRLEWSRVAAAQGWSAAVASFPLPFLEKETDRRRGKDRIFPETTKILYEFIQFRLMSHASSGHVWWRPGFGPLLSLRTFL